MKIISSGVFDVFLSIRNLNQFCAVISLKFQLAIFFLKI